MCVCSKVVDFRHPDELMKTMDLQLSQEPSDNEQLMDACRQIIKYSVKTGECRQQGQTAGGNLLEFS